MTTLNKDHCYHLDQSIQSDKGVIANWLNSAILFFPKFVKSVKNRRAVTPLLYASERELADIGLTLEDLQFIRNAGLYRDPTQELARQAHYRNRKMTL